MAEAATLAAFDHLLFSRLTIFGQTCFFPEVCDITVAIA